MKTFLVIRSSFHKRANKHFLKKKKKLKLELRGQELGLTFLNFSFMNLSCKNFFLSPPRNTKLMKIEINFNKL